MRWKRKWMWTMTAVGLALALPLTGYASGELNLGKTCSLTVNAYDPANQDEDYKENFVEDLKKADVVIDVYKVANAKKTVGSDGFEHDSYEYVPASGYESLDLSKKDMDSDAWYLKAQEAAQIALGLNGGTKGTPVHTGSSAGTKIEDLSAGLYLVIARSAELEETEDYVMPLFENDSETGEIGTIALSESRIYTFRPELISLPGILTGEEQPQGETGSYTWNYDLSVNLKALQSERFGRLELKKTLQNYEASQKAGFVFHVKAELNGKIVYDNVLTAELGGPGTVNVLDPLLELPTGAKVTVEQIYGAPAYELLTERIQETVIPANAAASLEFVSRYRKGQAGGGVLRNQFTYVAEDGRDPEWKVEQIGALRQAGSETEVEQHE